MKKSSSWKLLEEQYSYPKPLLFPLIDLKKKITHIVTRKNLNPPAKHSLYPSHETSPQKFRSRKFLKDPYNTDQSLNQSKRAGSFMRSDIAHSKTAKNWIKPQPKEKRQKSKQKKLKKIRSVPLIASKPSVRDLKTGQSEICLLYTSDAADE